MAAPLLVAASRCSRHDVAAAVVVVADVAVPPAVVVDVLASVAVVVVAVSAVAVAVALVAGQETREEATETCVEKETCVVNVGHLCDTERHCHCETLPATIRSLCDSGAGMPVCVRVRSPDAGRLSWVQGGLVWAKARDSGGDGAKHRSAS